jgi:hypothetical protein
VREVGSDTGSIDDIVKRQLIDEGTGLQEKGERLTNASSGTEDDCDECERWVHKGNALPFGSPALTMIATAGTDEIR